ncbi:MAG: SIS domain-containing protein [Armatimonadota bacterium]
MQGKFLSDVAMQPEALRDLINFYRKDGQPLLHQWAEMAKKSGQVVFSGMGTSKFAPEMVILSMAISGVDATTIDSSELLHYPRPVKGLPVLVSQSGESVETRKLLGILPKDAALVTITNTEGSTLARAAKLVLPMYAGSENSIASKTYINTLGVLYLMAKALNGQAAIDKALDELAHVADVMDQYDSEGVERAADICRAANVVQMIGRGPSMVAARQATLTFMEGCNTSATPLVGGQFRHGPFELVGSNHTCMMFIPNGKTYELLKSMAVEVAEKGSHVVVITDRKFDLPGANQVLVVPEVGEELFALAAAATHEVMLEAIARRYNKVPGDYIYGSKVTSVE